jgi:hypothetical protein
MAKGGLAASAGIGEDYAARFGSLKSGLMG